jgi:hypothetical protein
MLGHARPSMTLDTYTHLFEEARHGADVQAELARSDFANLLASAAEPLLQGADTSAPRVPSGRDRSRARSTGAAAITDTAPPGAAAT